MVYVHCIEMAKGFNVEDDRMDDIDRAWFNIEMTA